MTLSDLTTRTVNQQCDIALNILSVAAVRLTNVQPVHLGLDPAINRNLTIRYLLLRVRLVSCIVGTPCCVNTRTDILF